jgi:hypothetical protein
VNFVVFLCAVSFIKERDVIVATEESIGAKSSKTSASCSLAIAVPVILNKNSSCIILCCLLNSIVISNVTF